MLGQKLYIILGTDSILTMYEFLIYCVFKRRYFYKRKTSLKILLYFFLLFSKIKRPQQDHGQKSKIHIVGFRRPNNFFWGTTSDSLAYFCAQCTMSDLMNFQSVFQWIFNIKLFIFWQIKDGFFFNLEVSSPYFYIRDYSQIKLVHWIIYRIVASSNVRY